MVRTNRVAEPLGLEAIGLRWQTFLALGVLLVALGIFAMGAASLATLASVLVFGWALIVGGILQVVHAFSQPRWGGRVLDVLTGVLFVVVGGLTVVRPVNAALTLTLVIAVALIVRGVFAVIAAAVDRFPQWGWAVAYGVVSVLLGVVLASQWPGIALWAIGFFVGIELLADGIAMVMTGMAARKLRREVRVPPERPTRGEPLPAT